MKPIRTLAAATAIIALGLAISPAPRAYSTYGSWENARASFYVNPTNRDVSENAAISALQAGMEIWNTQPGTPFRFSYAGQVNDTTNTYDQRNVIIFRNDSNGGAIASQYSWRANGSIVDADIVFWDGAFKFFTGSSGCTTGAYIEDIAAHEMGHALGLLHSNITGATMYPSYSNCSMSNRTLSSDDIAAARSLYGTGGAVTDTAPVATILTPTNGASVPTGAPVTFTGSANDTPDGDLSSRLTWRSNIDGQIGTGATFSRAMTAGSHTITATVTDSTGHTSSKSHTLTVTSANTAPTVTISTPANGATVPEGTSMTFSGSASDAQNGNISGNLVWRSNIDGQIGTGASFTRTLSAGSHSIIASVTDSGGLTGQKNINVSVVAAGGTSPRLSARGYKDKGNQKADLSWNGLAGTNVDVYRDNVKIGSPSNDGSMTDNIDRKGNGSYSYKVCSAGTSTCTNQVNVTF